MRRLDGLSKRAYIQGKSLDEVGMLARTAGGMAGGRGGPPPPAGPPPPRRTRSPQKITLTKE